MVWITSTNGTQVKITSVTDSGDTFTAPGATCQAFTSGVGAVDAAYTLSSAGSKTVITTNTSPAASGFVVIYVTEWHPTIAATFDGCKAASNSSSASPPIPAGLSVTGTDTVTQFCIPANSITAIASPYTANANGITDGMGAAQAANLTSYSAVTWTQPSAGTSTCGAMSIK